MGDVYGARAAPHTPGLWNRVWAGHWRNTADVRGAGELIKIPNRSDSLVTLVRCRNTGRGDRALTGKGIDVLVGTDGRVVGIETVRQRLHEGHDQVFLLIRQLEITRRHIDVVRHLRLRPATNSFDGTRRAVSRRDGKLQSNRKRVVCVVEVDELFQALDVAVVEELLLEIRYRLAVRVDLAGLGSRALWRCQRHIARGRNLDLPIGRRRKL